MIDFSLSPKTIKALHVARENSEYVRTIARYYDDHEHQELLKEEILRIRANGADVQKVLTEPQPGDGGFLAAVILGEERAWGDAMLGGVVTATGGVGNAAMAAVATPEQRARFGKMHCAMAITEPGCGSDTAAVATTARLDPATNEWIINGEKIFVTSGQRCDAIVVWATLDKSVGRAAIKSFVVEKFRKGCILTKLEKKMGMRASDTAAIVFEDCRIPYDNILGSPEIKAARGGQAGVLATFDATRPGVAAMAIGVARAALDFTKEKLEEGGYNFPYDKGMHSLSAIQKEVLDLETILDVARLLVWKSAAMLDKAQRNSLEASMGKSKAGRTATIVCQRCVALLGPPGYSREWLAEKWLRDCKVNDIFEGTGQIQMLIVARTILGFTREQLK